MAAGLAASLAVVLAQPAGAHATLDKSSVPASSDQRLQARVPVERFDPPGTSNVKVIIEVPAAFTLKGCSPKLGWTCRTEARPGGGSLAVWERQSGVDAVDLLDFDVRTPGYRGVFAFEVNQFYSTGEVVNWDGPPDADHPAPQLEVTGSGEPPRENSAPADSHVQSGATTTTRRPAAQRTAPGVAAAPTTSTTVAAFAEIESTTSSTGTGLAAARRVTDNEDDGGGGAGPLIGAAVVLAGLAAGGAALVVRSRHV